MTGSVTHEVIFTRVTGWDEYLARQAARYEDGEKRLPDEPDARQRQMTRWGTRQAAPGLCC